MSASRQEDVSLLLVALRNGDSAAHRRLLPVVYDELRRLAQARMSHLPPGQTLQATALVHEAYLKLVGADGAARDQWDSRVHFFGAAARAMRNILVDRARRKASEKHGGQVRHALIDAADVIAVDDSGIDLLALDEALAKLETANPMAHQIVMLRFFAGLTEEQTAEALDMAPRTLRREWAYARAWLHRAMGGAARSAPKSDDGC